MPLNPSRRDTIAAPPRDGARDVSNLAALVRHQASAQRSIDPGLQDGRWRTPRPLVGGMPQVVGRDSGGDGETVLGEWDDAATVLAVGTQTKRLSHEPLEETLHVFWHPGGYGGVRMTKNAFTVTDQTVTIPDPGYFAAGDTFSFQYLYLLEQDEPIAPSVVGWTVPGAWDLPTKKVSFDLPVGTADGDVLILGVRGDVAPGGGEGVADISCSDPRMTLVHRSAATNGPDLVAAAVWIGRADSSGAPIVVDVVQKPGFTTSRAYGVLADITGINGSGASSSAAESSAVVTGASTPTVTSSAAVAVTWIRSGGFGIIGAAPPTGYTDIASLGAGYFSLDISWWYDANADPDTDPSPTGTFDGEGCSVIALI